ncbi:MAG TPA: nucleotide sugar dehydrogenase [Ktedonobacteraceae bacterium]|nr:nucleotide sugar dehydrogenase [Ktedonobacteraceae bacterium]
MLEKFSDASLPRLTIAVVGMGKIGLPLAVQYASHQHKVIGCDSNPAVVESLNAGHSHIQEEPELLHGVPGLVREGLLSATTDTSAAVKQADVVVVIVPVFVDASKSVDFRWIDAATSAIGAGLKRDTLVIYETTLPVGTTTRHLLPLLEASSGLQAGTDFALAYSPERVSSGSIFRDLRTYPKVIGGINADSLERAVSFYRSVLEADIIRMASTDEAEFVKLIETTYRDVNIALANGYAKYADSHQLNVHAAIAAANTQPYSHIHTPGVGVGGHCIPVYPYFLFANPFDRQHGDGLDLPRHARQFNDTMADYGVQRIESLLGSLDQKSALILGIAYRGNVKETAFTSAKLLQEALTQRGATVYVDDPLFSDSEIQALGYTPVSAAQEGRIEAIILQSGHQQYHDLDFGRFPGCKVILDGRQFFAREKIERLGMDYIAIGAGEDGKAKIPTFESAGSRMRG